MNGETAMGEALKRARLEKGSSLEEASRHTRISKKFLEALECSRPEDLPAPVYFEGFLKTYCEYLGVSPDAVRKLSLSIEPNLTPVEVARPAQHLEKPPQESEPAHAALPHEGHYRLLMAVCVAALSGSAFWLWHEAGVLNGPAAGAPLSAAMVEALPENSSDLGQNYKEDLTIIFHQGVRIHVIVDGKTAFKGVASQGQMQEWKAHKIIVLETANPEAFDLMLNGAPYSLAPNSSEQYAIRAP